MIRPVLSILIFSFFWSCTGNNDPFAECKYSQPEPIFSAEIPRITEHSFQLKRTSGVEQVTFENGMLLQLVQSGCDAIRQEFEFKLTGDFHGNTPEFWIEQSMEQFAYLGSLSPSFIAFNAWTQAIEAIRDRIQIGQFTELQPGYYIKIDKVLSSDHAILMVTLTEQP